ncbi:MAG: hypothetical protein L0Z48_07960 [candidate division Zixibacteria bacterium]|nr:hypothetical protein [candidate division Zixibacteria bacterium]MCI0596463.1 hypothetical protein [candidate division Zixibacteria bacterium]
MKSVLNNSNVGAQEEETKPLTVSGKRRNLQGFLDEVPDRIYLGLVRIQELSRDGQIENRKATAAIQEALNLEAYPPQAVRRLTGIFSHRGYLEKVIKSGMLKGYRITDLGKQVIAREIQPGSEKARPGRKLIFRLPKLSEEDFHVLLERAKAFEEASRKLKQNEKELALIKKKREKLTARRDHFTAQLNELLSQQGGILEENQQLRKLASQSTLAAEKLREIRDIIQRG